MTKTTKEILFRKPDFESCGIEYSKRASSMKKFDCFIDRSMKVSDESLTKKFVI